MRSEERSGEGARLNSSRPGVLASVSGKEGRTHATRGRVGAASSGRSLQSRTEATELN